MKLVTPRLPRRTTAARADGEHAVEVGVRDVGEAPAEPHRRESPAFAGAGEPAGTARRDA